MVRNSSTTITKIRQTSAKKKGIAEISAVCIEIQNVFDQADHAFAKNPAEADELVANARRIAMKARIRLTREQKRRFCSHCYAYLVPSINLRVRTRPGMLVYSCLRCKRFMRFPLR